MNLGERPGPTAWSQALVHREPGQRSCEQCPVRTRKRPALRLHRDSPPPHLHSDRRARGQQPLEQVTEGLSSGPPLSSEILPLRSRAAEARTGHGGRSANAEGVHHGHTSGSPRELLEPLTRPTPIKSESLGWGPSISVSSTSPGIQGVARAESRVVRLPWKHSESPGDPMEGRPWISRSGWGLRSQQAPRGSSATVRGPH